MSTFATKAAMMLMAVLVVSCSDFDNNYTETELRYNQNFTDEFGDIDPDQNWNMAKHIDAEVSLGSNPSVSVYTNRPGSTDAKLLSTFQGSGSFDIPKSLSEVFVVVSENNKTIAQGFYDVDDNMIDINTTNAETCNTRKVSSATRATNSITKGTKLFVHTAWDKDQDWDGKSYYLYQYYSHEKQIQLRQENGAWYIYYNDNANSSSSSFRKLAHNDESQYGTCGYADWKTLYYADGNKEVAMSNGPGWSSMLSYSNGTLTLNNADAVKVLTRKSYDAPYYTINGDTKTDDVQWFIGDCKDLFWTSDPCAFFREGISYKSAQKKALYEAQGVTVDDLEKGVVYTTSKEDDEINIPMMYGATANSNILGYYYYTDEQDPREVNRYVLYEDASPKTNIKVDGNALSDGMAMQMMQYGWTDESIVSCTNRRLVYFGEDGNSEGTFKFPKNVHIGFFIRHKVSSASQYSNTCENGWAYSDPELNKCYFYDQNGLNSTCQQFWGYRGDDKTKGNVKAITWNYDGRILVGFGDDSGDLDLNDFVFWLDGDFEERPVIEISSEDNAYEWLIASEDMGSSEDYDFNDIVFGVKHYTSKTTMKTEYVDVKTGEVVRKGLPKVIDWGNSLLITPYAAGGTLKTELYLTRKGETTCLGEIHALLDNANAEKYAQLASGDMPMLNTDSLTCKGTSVLVQLDEDEDFDISNNMGGLELKVAKVGETQATISAVQIKAPEEGNVPQMLVLPQGWQWPSERTDIKDAYPDFTNWVGDATNTDWSNKRADKKTVNR